MGAALKGDVHFVSHHGVRNVTKSVLGLVLRVHWAMERDEAAFTAGCEAARADIRLGRLVYRWSGHAGHWGHWVVAQLAARFGVAVDDGFAVCFVTTASVSFNEGYNSVLAAEIDRRHGSGSLDSVFAESRNQSEESLGEARRSWLKRKGLA